MPGLAVRLLPVALCLRVPLRACWVHMSPCGWQACSASLQHLLQQGASLASAAAVCPMTHGLTPFPLCAACRHVDFHNAGWEATTRAMEATVHSDKALPIFDKAIDRFKEVTCTGLLNWGNVHTCIAHKYLDEAAAAGGGLGCWLYVCPGAGR